jgi:hypothetical protein
MGGEEYDILYLPLQEAEPRVRYETERNRK